MTHKSVIIIGAGPAGLTAAYELLQKTDIKPIILEETPYVGGISRTACHHGNRMDLGGHRFFSKSEQVMEIWQKLMPIQGAPAFDDRVLAREREWNVHGPDPEANDRVMLIRNRVSRIFFLRRLFDYPISLKWGTLRNMGLVRTFKVGAGYLAAAIRKLPERSLEDFYINRFGRPLYELFFEDYTEKLWGIHPSKIAPDWGAQRVKGLSLGKALLTKLLKPFRKAGEVETSLIESFYYPKFGPGQYWETMAQEIRNLGGQLIMNATVDALVPQPDRSIIVQAVCCGQSCYRHRSGHRGSEHDYGSSVVHRDEHMTFQAEAVFSSMPIKDLVTAMGEQVPAVVSDIAKALPYRDFMTVGLLVRKLQIENRTSIRTLGNIVPDCWIYIQERSVRLGRLQIFNNWSPYMVANPEESVWIGLEYFCNEGDSQWQMDDSGFIAKAIDELTSIGVIQRTDVIDSTLIRVKKAYPAYFGSYNRFDTVRCFLDSIPGLYCIGRNGQHRYNNMDHSMLTAIEAVRCYRHQTDKTAIWQVNAEQQYHETISTSIEASRSQPQAQPIADS